MTPTRRLTLDDLRGAPREPTKWALRVFTPERRRYALREACSQPVSHFGRYPFRNGESPPPARSAVHATP